ncbi:MAG: HEAT repeat domain-containing protein [Burkholderiales bacterium]
MHQLEKAVAERNGDALWTLVPAVDGYSEAVPILSRLLLEDWHESHEDIVFTLGLIGDPRATNSIAKAVRIPFASLAKGENLHEFQRKCAYALARIGTPESRAALEALAMHSDPHLQKYGAEGLGKCPRP